MSSERQQLNAKDPWWGEHVHRYNEVLPYLNKKDTILDIACGTGFGSDILAQNTDGDVVGGDIAAEAVSECNQNWNRCNLSFKVLDGTALPYTDGFFDRIVSFETIEHTTKYKEMLNEFSRVLKPDGIAFISTPNFLINSPSGKIVNPFHTQEFVYDELKEVLQDVFSNVKIYGQKFSRYDNEKANKFGKTIYSFFNIIGIRKFIPYGIKNRVSLFFTGKTFYPSPDDFSMVTSVDEINKCTTFFCICKK